MKKTPSDVPQTIIERDVFCPYCQENSAFLISEMIDNTSTIQLPEVGCTNAALMMITGGCWALVSCYTQRSGNSDEKHPAFSNISLSEICSKLCSCRLSFQAMLFRIYAYFH